MRRSISCCAPPTASTRPTSATQACTTGVHACGMCVCVCVRPSVCACVIPCACWAYPRSHPLRLGGVGCGGRQAGLMKRGGPRCAALQCRLLVRQPSPPPRLALHHPPHLRSEVAEDTALLKSQANALLAECGLSGGSGGAAGASVGLPCCLQPPPPPCRHARRRGAPRCSRALSHRPTPPLCCPTHPGVSDDLVGEVVRCGAGELHVVAAVVGAIASQEAIKLITGQYVPVGGTLIYNAMSCTSSVLPL